MAGLELVGSFKVLLREIVQQRAAGYCRVTLKFDNFSVTARGENMAYTLPVDRQVGVTVAYVDAKGNAAEVDGAPEWASSDETIATVTANPDGMSATVAAIGNTGNAQITVTADADMGEGVRNLTTIMGLTVIAGEAVAGTITPSGEPEPIPDSAQSQPAAPQSAQVQSQPAGRAAPAAPAAPRTLPSTPPQPTPQPQAQRPPGSSVPGAPPKK